MVWERALMFFAQAAGYYALCFFIFYLLERRWPGVPGARTFRRGYTVDMAYWLLGPVVYGFLAGLLIAVGLIVLEQGDAEVILTISREGRKGVATLPLWLQILLILLLSDIIQYWLHRGFHGSSLWKYHAVHHSSTELDWLSATRFHPVNHIISFTLVLVLMILLGFSPLAFLVLAPFNVIYSAFVHANLNWSLGPLKYVVATPVFHRWHHTLAHEAQGRNFAPTFPFLDILFGTFYMPREKQPQHFGIAPDNMPETLWGQLMYPFKASGR